MSILTTPSRFLKRPRFDGRASPTSSFGEARCMMALSGNWRFAFSCNLGWIPDRQLQGSSFCKQTFNDERRGSAAGAEPFNYQRRQRTNLKMALAKTSSAICSRRTTKQHDMYRGRMSKAVLLWQGMYHHAPSACVARRQTVRSFWQSWLQVSAKRIFEAIFRPKLSMLCLGAGQQ